jgi:prepilin-type N-terminal cleavage/methylation domain-containing protein
LKEALMNKKGFTLIELLIVVAIIGILAMIGIPAYIGQQKNAARSEAYTNLQNLRLLEEQFYAENSAYTISMGTQAKDNPGNVADIQNGVPAGGGAAVPTNALPGFKPGNGLSYSYCVVQNIQITNASTNPPQTGAQTPCFVAYAYGNTTSRVNGDVFAIDCNNNRNF